MAAWTESFCFRCGSRRTSAQRQMAVKIIIVAPLGTATPNATA
jgi:hypothetical protein